jgi:mono/diheme cytochrome c family protein
MRTHRTRSRLLRWVAGGWLAVASAQTPTVWDGAYTAAQAERGAMSFERSCAGCHALATEGKAPLVGDVFWKSFAQKTVGELYQFVRQYMPNGQPGSLSEATYADITALMLKSNGFPAGPREFSPTLNPDLQIVPKDGNTELPANALVRFVGCLSRTGTDWTVVNATMPERAERNGKGDATRTLGTRRFQLQFVLTKLDALLGTRVAVTGLLIGAGGADGINVTSVNRLAPTCP